MPQLLTAPPAARLEANLVAYIKSTIIALGLTTSNSQVISSNSFAERSKRVVIEIDAQTDCSTAQMGYLFISSLVITISGQTEGLKKVEHATIANQIINSLVYVTPRLTSLTQARDELLAACNLPVGTDLRPAGRIHVLDVREISTSLGQADSTADTVVTATVDFFPVDVSATV